jgi:hypothetical protein
MSKRSEHNGKVEEEFSGLERVFHAVACAFDKDDFGVVKKAVEDGGCNGTVAVEDSRPLLEGFVGGKHDGAALVALCLGGRGAAPPESCGGPRGYRLMLKRQQQGAAISDPALVEATIQLLSATHPAEPASTWSLLRDAVREGWQNVDRRLLEHGPLEPSRFSLQEANERLSRLSRGRTWL